MWILNKVLSFLIFPANWFWESYEKYKKENNIWKVIVLFMVSALGLLATGYAVIILAIYLFYNHFEKILFGFLIGMIFAYVKWNRDKKAEENILREVDVSIREQEEMAKKGYIPMRNVIYQSLKACADQIGGKIPRLAEEIEVLDRHFILDSGICFYQFKVEKDNIREGFNREEIKELKSILQVTISRMIQSGEINFIKAESILDDFGRLRDIVEIDNMEDMGTFFLIQTVYYSKQYGEYYKNKEMNRSQQNRLSNVPNARWKE